MSTPQEASTTPSDEARLAEAFRLQSIADFAEDGVHGPIAENVAEVERTAFLAGFRKANELAAAEIAELKAEYAKRKIQVVRSDKAFRELAQERDAIRAENAELKASKEHAWWWKEAERVAVIELESLRSQLAVATGALENIIAQATWFINADEHRAFKICGDLARSALTTLSPAEGKGGGG